MIKLYLLGSLRVLCHGEEMAISQRKAGALLAYLALQDQPCHRDQLAALLWPEQNQQKARANLRYTLWWLRKTLGAQSLQSHGDAIALARSSGADTSVNEHGDTAREDTAAHWWVDVTAFQAHLAQAATVHQLPKLDRADANGSAIHRARTEANSPTTMAGANGPKAETPEIDLQATIHHLQTAVDLYQGDFLRGFTLADSAAFDEWQTLQSELLRGQVSHALATLSDLYGALGDEASAIAGARRWVALDPLCEPAHRRLMQMLARNGQSAAAIRQYAECEGLLKEEIGAQPEEATTALLAQIQAGRAQSVAQSQPGNLPVQPTPFVGRRAQLAQLAELLANPQCRLLTIVGVGGIGKTRLALEAAGQARFADGVWFVALAHLRTADLLATAIAEAVHAPGLRTTMSATPLFDFLRDKNALLILDSLEHLVESAAFLAYLLAQAPHVRLLVTSRERLNLQEEWLYPLTGMQTPTTATPNSEGLSLAQARDHDAVHFFEQCATRLRPDFGLTPANLPHVIRICQLVEGLPLAIELAAGWLHAMPLATIAQEIEQRLDLLASRVRNAPARQRSIRAVFDHSWHLLPGDLRAKLCQLALFRGGFLPDAARAVARVSMDELATLIDKSWLRLEPNGRYAMHELVRQYCAHHLEEGDGLGANERAHAVHKRHCAYYGDYLRRHTEFQSDPEHVTRLHAVLDDFANVWAAWQWAVDQMDVEWLGQAVDGLDRMADLHGVYAEIVHLFAIAARRLRQQLALIGNGEAEGQTNEPRAMRSVLARILVWQAYFSLDMGRLAEAEAMCEESLQLVRHPDNEIQIRALLHNGKNSSKASTSSVAYGIESFAANDQHSTLERWQMVQYAKTVGMLGYVFYHQSRYAEVDPLYRESLAGLAAAGEKRLYTRTLAWLGLNLTREGRYAEAEASMRQSLGLAQVMEDEIFAVCCKRMLATAIQMQGNYAQAEPIIWDALAQSQALEDTRQICHNHLFLAHCLLEQARYEEAQQQYALGLAMTERSGDRLAAVACQNGLGEIALARDDLEQARTLFQKSVVECRQMRRIRDLITGLIGLGNVATAAGEVAQAYEPLREAIEIAYANEDRPNMLAALVALAALHIAQNQPDNATVLLTSVLHHPAAMAATKTRARRLIERLPHALPVQRNGMQKEETPDQLSRLVADSLAYMP